MKPAKVLACCLLVFPLVGTAPESVPHHRAKPLQLTRERTARLKPLEALKQEGLDLLRHGRYSEAEPRFDRLRQAALALQEFDMAARATANVGACQLARRQYQAARLTYLDARRVAQQAGDTSVMAIADANLGSIYFELGDLDAAAQWTQRSFEHMSGKDRKEHLPELQIQLASLRARQKRDKEALELFRQGIAGADRAGNLALYALGWNRLGEELLKARHLPEAESALLEAYRVRKLHHLPLDTSYRSLGRLRMEQGDLASASALLDRAVELAAAPQGPIPGWDVYHYRGRVRLKQGRLREAMDDLRIAMRLARAWRWSVPDDTSRIGAEGWLDQVHAALIEAGNRLYLETGDPALLRETFEAAEENRASSLRALVSERQAQIADLPAAYWEAMARLQRAEVAALRGGDPAAGETVKATRAELVGMEAALVSPTQPRSNEVLARAASALDPETVLFSFHLGDSRSWLWALDRAGAALYSLPPREEMESQIQAAARAVREDTAEAATSGAMMYRTLFGQVSPRFRRKPHWLLSLDPALLDVPVAALLEETAPRPIYVVERHTTEVIPGAGYWLEASGRQGAVELSPLFVGIGDAIYNSADQRKKPQPPAKLRWWRPLRLDAAPREDRLILPRLVGSGAELDACARAWRGESVLLKGAEASRLNLIEQVRRKPAVIHFATHVLGTEVTETHAAEGRVRGSANRPAYGLIALSLTEHGEPELLPPREIARWRVVAGLVVLSGCESAGGTVLQGTGLMGLTRAWLAAGAQSVMGSRWATADEDGGLFRVFYRSLSESRRGPAQALRAAQQEMIRAGGWRARPRYWGAYFMMGNQ